MATHSFLATWVAGKASISMKNQHKRHNLSVSPCVSDMTGQCVRPRTILIVDDYVPMAQSIEHILAKAGYKVITAYDGAECIDQARQMQPDLILLDIVLPDADGLDICRMLKADPRTEKIHIIFMTGIKTKSDDKATGLRAGADGYITKPIHKEEFLARIEAVIRVIQIEEELRKREEHYRIVADNTYDWEYWLLPDGRIQYCSPSCERITGYSVREFMIDPQLTHRIVHPDDLPKWNDHQKITQSPDHYHFIYRIISRDGRNVWISHHCVAIFSNEGQYLGRRVSNRDISEQKQAEDALARSEEIWRLALSNIQDTVVLTDEHDNITFVCPNVHFIFGYSTAEVHSLGHINKLLPDLVYDAEKLESIGVLENIKCTVTDKDGKIHETLVGVKKINFQVHKYLYTVHEATELMDYTARLIEAQKKAGAANLAKSEFIANMSHEFRTPLNGILCMMQILETTGLNPEQKELVLLGRSSAMRLTDLMTNIIDLSRIEAGRMFIREQEFSVRNICDTIYDLFSMSVREKGLSLECILDKNLPEKIIGDETRMHQVLINLVGNAVKYTSTGKITLEVAIIVPRKNGTMRVLFSVCDTGIGIPEKKLDKLFQPFMQVDNSLTRDYQGAGLGLAIVRRLVDMMGGNISMESEPGAGTVVHVVLPVKVPKS